MWRLNCVKIKWCDIFSQLCSILYEWVNEWMIEWKNKRVLDWDSEWGRAIKSEIVDS